ncbi:alpha/beta-hydrolase [Dacryopinax primogenitus]|uniref:Carboxylic ester hydrolase n=1 Tax=Dacryopinax primogenitus (strain DJM 731) TaxID=1858805 RepID=M5FY91_DACPD|nr:alpha/beta-hydrolase [Dacryopinax primogenitus]EJU00785.1 alpha/beta-hydrolase [Dacryopinax primogenitus]
MMLNFLLACLQASASAGAAVGGPQVALEYGTFLGWTNTSNGVELFLGLPYAAPPVGDKRLRHPAPVNSFQGVQDATRQKADCMQAPSALNPIPASLLEDFANISATTSSRPGVVQTANTSEGCLYVNLFRPEGTREGAKLPVLFWIYGGGGINGRISAYVLPGQNIVQTSVENGQPIIFVAVNYRMSIWGFLPGQEVIDAGVSNLGILDQRAALDWVQKYVAAFGGDPENVTVSGGSAGAICTFFQLLMYGGQNAPFKRAILKSGSLVPMAPSPAAYPQARFDKFVALVGCAEAVDKISCLRGVPNELLAESVGNTTFWWTIKDLVLYAPQVDGWTLPDTPQNLLRQGRFAKVPIIVGDVMDEGAGFEAFWCNVTDEEGFEGWMENLYVKGRLKRNSAAYPQDPAQGSPFGTGNLYQLTPQTKRMNAIFGDYLFVAARRFVLSQYTAQGLPAWSYLYGHSRTAWYGASHGSDIASLFGLLKDQVSRGMMTAYISFVTTGNPNACCSTKSA